MAKYLVSHISVAAFKAALFKLWIDIARKIVGAAKARTVRKIKREMVNSITVNREAFLILIPPKLILPQIFDFTHWSLNFNFRFIEKAKEMPKRKFDFCAMHFPQNRSNNSLKNKAN